MEVSHRLTSDVPIAETSVRYRLLQERSYLHKANRLSLDSGDNPSSHMSSKTSRLRGGMSLFQVSDDPVVAVIQLTMNTRAEPDLVKVSGSMNAKEPSSPI